MLRPLGFEYDVNRPDIKRRYVAAMKQYCAGTIAQVRQTTLTGSPDITLEQVLQERRQSVCVLPLFALLEFAHDISLPDDVYDEKPMREVRELGIDITLLHNDLLSYHKEESEGVQHNILAAYGRKGKTAQEAVDLVGAEIHQRALLLERIIGEIDGRQTPSHDESMRYVQGIRDVIKANLYWSFHSDRFLSDEQKIRLLISHTLEAASSPPYLCQTEPQSQRPPILPDSPESGQWAVDSTFDMSDGGAVAPQMTNKMTARSLPRARSYGSVPATLGSKHTLGT